MAAQGTNHTLRPPLETLKEIFHSARELRVEEREAFLDQACVENDELRKEIDSLLESDRASKDFIADPPARLAAELFETSQDSADVGRKIGQYKLLESIGSGGMGTVYLAERADQQFRMQVAIKLIKRGMDTDQVLRRFQHERQILASLEHQNIARLLDGGTTDDGLPYFVMEYIKGERIDRYAEARRLSIDARLELFRQVCGAVSYAHQNLIVHRDLKPSNILVTAEGVPKLLDFGIAKIIQAGEGAEALATITIMSAMTPEYASPEQIEGTHATTLSDVYSLGAVLYELLSGQPPHQFQNRSAQEITKSITTAQIEKPSAVITRGEDARRLRGDLDNIVLMAMRKETARRYRSVEQFSEDIRRHLEGLPVIARVDTLSYRAGKFWQRNRLALSASVIFALTLIGGIIATTWEARAARLQEQRARIEQARAERRFNEVRSLAHSVLFDYHDAIKSLPGATKVRELLVKDALTYLDSLAGEAQGDPALQRELATAYERVGDVRGGLSNGSRDDIAGALESYTKALQICENLVALNPKDLQAQRGLASSHYKIGYRLYDTAQSDDGIEHLRKAHALYLDLTRKEPGNDELQLEFANSCIQLGRALSDTDPLRLALYRTAQEISEKLVARHPREQSYRYALMSSQYRMAHTLWLQNDLAGGIQAGDRAGALGEALLAEDPLNADYRRTLARIYQYGGTFRKEHDQGAAIEYFGKAIALENDLLVSDPGNALIRKDLATTHKKIADLLLDLKDDSQTLFHYDQALKNYEKVVAGSPADLICQFLVVSCHGGVARMRARLGQAEAALQECEKGGALLQKITGAGPGYAGKAQACQYLGYAYEELANKTSGPEAKPQWSAARDMLRESMKIIEESRKQDELSAHDDSWGREIADEIAKCDAALEK